MYIYTYLLESICWPPCLLPIAVNKELSIEWKLPISTSMLCCILLCLKAMMLTF